MTTSQVPIVSTESVHFCGVLMWYNGLRYLTDEPGDPQETSCWDKIAEYSVYMNPWYAPIEDEE